MPKQGDIKTWPNGKRGVWDGYGWEHVPSPTEDAAAALHAPPPPSGPPVSGDNYKGPDTFMGGFTQHMLQEEPAALGALGTLGVMGAGAAGLPAAAVTALTSGAPLAANLTTRLSRWLGGKPQTEVTPGEVLGDVVMGPGLTYGPRAVGGLARGVAGSPIAQKLIGGALGTGIGKITGHPYLGGFLGLHGGAPAIEGAASKFATAGEGAPGRSMERLHNFLTGGGKTPISSQFSEAEKAGMKPFDPSGNVGPLPKAPPTPPAGPAPGLAHEMNVNPVTGKPRYPTTSNTPAPPTPRPRLSTPHPTNWEGGSGKLVPKVAPAPTPPAPIPEEPFQVNPFKTVQTEMELPQGRAVRVQEPPPPPPRVLQSSPTDPQMDWLEYKNTTRPKRVGAGGGKYSVEVLDPIKGLRESVPTPKPTQSVKDVGAAADLAEPMVENPFYPNGPADVPVHRPTQVPEDWYAPGLGPAGKPYRYGGK